MLEAYLFTYIIIILRPIILFDDSSILKCHFNALKQRLIDEQNVTLTLTKRFFNVENGSPWLYKRRRRRAVSQPAKRRRPQNVWRHQWPVGRRHLARDLLQATHDILAARLHLWPRVYRLHQIQWRAGTKRTTNKLARTVLMTHLFLQQNGLGICKI